jgi:hypothetical protein
MSSFMISGGCNDCSPVNFGNDQFLSPQDNTSTYLADNVSSNISNTGSNPFQSNQPQQQQQQPQPIQQIQQQPQQKPIVTFRPSPQQPQYQYDMGQQQAGFKESVSGFMKSSTFKLMVALLAAMAWNECIKYYINNSLKMGTGNPTYFIGYGVVATLVLLFIQ